MISEIREPDKPLDVGNGVLVASVSPRGALLSLGMAHSRWGFVELSALPEFDERWRARPDAVRRYRELMTLDRYAVLNLMLSPPAPLLRERFLLIGGVLPGYEAELVGCSYRVTTAPLPRDAGVRQRHILVRSSSHLARAAIQLRARLDRHPLAEITETHPPEPSGVRSRIRADGNTLIVEAGELPAYSVIVVQTSNDAGMWTIDRSDATFEIPWPRAGPSRLEIVITSRMAEGHPGEPLLRRVAHRHLGDEPAKRRARVSSVLVVPEQLRRRLEWVAFRSLQYVRGCTALEVSPGEVCLLTDHRVLPLSWTRDSYYQAALLLAEGSTASVQIVASHLRWLWRRCERSEGRWMRSHLPSGAPKDLVFQADQQLYPLLELCDYWERTGALPALPGTNSGSLAESWGALVLRAWDALSTSDGILIPTEENPADDPTDLPFLLSTQILCWYTARRLDQLGKATGVGAGIDLERVIGLLPGATNKLFSCEGPRGTQWAYATDGRSRRLYSDANDVPTALAPLWGYCAPDDPLWVTTIEFTFSTHNPGYSPGPRGGLGSLHTPGTWTLGDIQEWVTSSLRGDRENAGEALARLLDAATSDGMLPEAYDSSTGSLSARHWFAWPGALLGALYWSAYPAT